MEEIEFLAKFAQKMKFHENGGNFVLKLNIQDDINSLIGIQFFILDLKTLSSTILMNLAPPQTDETEIGRKLILKPISR